MTEKIKKHLTDYAISKGWETDDDTLFEIVREGKRVYEENSSEHRWYVDQFRVVEVNGMHIGYDDFFMTGDNSASDMGLKYDYNSICEVKQVQKTITVYEKI